MLQGSTIAIDPIQPHIEWGTRGGTFIIPRGRCKRKRICRLQGSTIAIARIQTGLYIMLSAAARPNQDGPMRIGVVCIPQVRSHVGDRAQPAQKMCFFTSAMQIDLEAVMMPHVPVTCTLPPRWSCVGEVCLSRQQLNSSITSNLQRLPLERVQVEVPEGVVLVLGLVRGDYPRPLLQLTSRPSRIPIIRRHDKRRPEDRLTLMPALASRCGRQKLEPKQLRSLKFESCFTSGGHCV